MKAKLKSWLWAFLRLLKIDAFYRKPGYHYVPDYFGRSAHKQLDIRTIPVFGETAGKIIQDGRVSLYFDRLYTVYQILFNWNIRTKNGREVLNTAEVGVYKGGTSYFIASIAKQMGMPIRHFCFDTFEGHAAEDINLSVETSHFPHAFNDTSFESVKDYLKYFENVSVHKGRIQDTAHILQDSLMHFVHLDMDIYEPTLFALQFFTDRMVQGGVVLLDDYGFETCPGIEKAVNEFLSMHSNYFGTALLSGQFILVKL
ncbi:MAG TPA: TylF/MycF/NovP-related O-methyltransferase [Anaerolineales bacterium]|nr:TylF/MycF/NovP-related O-methyltransferase [Anaerolineales bacterium]HNA89350.1 TylF/MycF/NovP-related O-methyltransferase [Anaerolineales bacterium]